MRKYNVDAEMSHREIAEELGVTATRAQQIEQRALEKLRSLPEAASLREFLEGRVE